MPEKRPVGRPPKSSEEQAQREMTIDTHLNLPKSIIDKVDRLKRAGESRKDCIVRLLREIPIPEEYQPSNEIE